MQGARSFLQARGGGATYASMCLKGFAAASHSNRVQGVTRDAKWAGYWAFHGKRDHNGFYEREALRAARGWGGGGPVECIMVA
jgi:hypothetical protein